MVVHLESLIKQSNSRNSQINGYIYSVYSADITGGKLTNVYTEVYNGAGCNSTSPTLQYGQYSNAGSTFNTSSCTTYGNNNGAIFRSISYAATLPTVPTNGLPYVTNTMYSASACSGPSWNTYYYGGKGSYCSTQSCLNSVSGNVQNNAPSSTTTASAGGIVCPTKYGLGCTNPGTCTSAGSIKTGYLIFMQTTSSAAAFTYAQVAPFGVCNGGAVYSGGISPSGAVEYVVEGYNNDIKCQASSSSGQIAVGVINSTYSPYNYWNTISYAQSLTIPSTGTYKIMYVMISHRKISIRHYLFHNDDVVQYAFLHSCFLSSLMFCTYFFFLPTELRI